MKKAYTTPATCLVALGKELLLSETSTLDVHGSDNGKFYEGEDY